MVFMVICIVCLAFYFNSKTYNKRLMEKRKGKQKLTKEQKLQKRIEKVKIIEERRIQQEKERKLKQEKRQQEREERRHQRLIRRKNELITNILAEKNKIKNLTEKIEKISSLNPTSNTYKLQQAKDFVKVGKEIKYSYSNLQYKVTELSRTLYNLEKYGDDLSYGVNIVSGAKYFIEVYEEFMEKLDYTIKDVEQSLREYEQAQQQAQQVEYEVRTTFFFWKF